MSDQAVEHIVCFWREYGNDQVTGLVGLDAKFDGKIIGTRFPENVKDSTLSDLYRKYKVTGDKKLVYRSELTRKTPPYPIYKGEKYCPLAYKYILIDQEGPLLLMNQILCHVEYLEDGSSMNMINQYKKNPRGFLIYRMTTMLYSHSFKERFRASIHYVSSSLMIRNLKFLIKSPNKLTTLLATPIGVALFLYIQNTKKATVFKGN
jgi:hypothetical protein